MALKILAGFLAALVLTGAGVYFAIPSSTATAENSAQSSLPTSEGSSCCSKLASGSCLDSGSEMTGSTDSFAACTGGTSAAMAQAGPSACKKKTLGCCDE